MGLLAAAAGCAVLAAALIVVAPFLYGGAFRGPSGLDWVVIAALPVVALIAAVALPVTRSGVAAGALLGVATTWVAGKIGLLVLAFGMHLRTTDWSSGTTAAIAAGAAAFLSVLTILLLALPPAGRALGSVKPGWRGSAAFGAGLAFAVDNGRDLARLGGPTPALTLVLPAVVAAAGALMLAVVGLPRRPSHVGVLLVALVTALASVAAAVYVVGSAAATSVNAVLLAMTTVGGFVALVLALAPFPERPGPGAPQGPAIDRARTVG